MAAAWRRYVHSAAREGFGAAKAYDVARPSYPPAAIKFLCARLANLEVPPSHPNIEWDLIDVGAGTGKFTRALRDELAHNWHWGRHDRRVLAVEPVAEMRAAIEARAVADGDGFMAGHRAGSSRLIITGGHADALPVGDASVGNVVAGQAFHWFAPHDAAVREFARVLAPGGALGLIWNTRTPHDPKGSDRWLVRLEKLLVRRNASSMLVSTIMCLFPYLQKILTPTRTMYDCRAKDGYYAQGDGGAVPRQQTKEWRGVFDAPDGAARELFTPLQEHRVRWAQRLDDDALVARIMTISVLARLEGTARADAAEAVRTLVAERMDDVLPYETAVYWAHKLGA